MHDEPGLLRYEIQSARLISSNALTIIPLTTHPVVGNPTKPFGCQKMLLGVCGLDVLGRRAGYVTMV